MQLNIWFFGIRPVFLALLICVVSGCGFHLRGKVDISDTLSKLTLEGKSHADFLKRLELNLRRNGVQISNDASYRLVVTEIQEFTEAQVVVASEYLETLLIKVVVQLKTKDNLNLFSPKVFRMEQRISGERNKLNSAIVLSGDIFRDMRTALIIQIVRWVSGMRDEIVLEEERRARGVKEKQNNMNNR